MSNSLHSQRAICIFAYSFPHKKSYDFLTFLKAHGFNNVCVIGAPKVKLATTTNKKLYSSLPSTYPTVLCADLCKQLGYKYIESRHSDEQRIRDFLSLNDCLELGVVSGARILSANVIALFEKGIINFHPGEIPETSGLDSFYWMLENNATPGTTVHYIDHKVDAGHSVFFHRCDIDADDTPQTVNAKLYDNQLSAFNRLLELLKVLPVLIKSKIERPKKNQPMSCFQKIDSISTFENWKKSTLSQQHYVETIFKACETGDLVLLQNKFKDEGKLLLNNFGWSPMIIAAFNQNIECVNYLINHGGDVNTTNDKGTSVLMYAKTALINADSPELDLIELLLSSGADIEHKDLFGKDIFYYIDKNEKLELSLRIKSLLNAIH
jgi:phosphoribosylglycinamide formyltransferase-1